MGMSQHEVPQHALEKVDFSEGNGTFSPNTVGRGTSLHEAFCDFEWSWSARDPENMRHNVLDNKGIVQVLMLWNVHVPWFMVRSFFHQIIHSGFGPVVLEFYREPPKLSQRRIAGFHYPKHPISS